MSHKAGFVNIIGNPNVGKSTLMNAFGGKIINHYFKHKQHVIEFWDCKREDFQMILSDTQELLPAYEMQESMMNFVKSLLKMLIFDLHGRNRRTRLKDEAFFNKIIHSKIPVLLLLNKIDNSNQEQLEEQVAFGQKVPNAEIPYQL
jgi:GTP-binding protein Era